VADFQEPIKFMDFPGISNYRQFWVGIKNWQRKFDSDAGPRGFQYRMCKGNKECGNVKVEQPAGVG